ncbi:phage holin family protein [Jatrophihabitans sp. YIM 134969]
MSTTAPDGQTPPSVGELVAHLSEQTSTLVRQEMALAKAEMTQKGKAAGLGVGLFGGAGVFVLYGVGAFVAAAIMGLATAVPGWLAALIVGAALLVVAGIAAVLGKKEVSQATPPVPEQTVASVKQDVDAVKEAI